MKKLLVAAVFITALFAAQNANGQSLSSDKQAIINKQRAEIQQKRNSANEYQKQADEAGKSANMRLWFDL
jgi:Flp pilus assembly protein TadB